MSVFCAPFTLDYTSVRFCESLGPDFCGSGSHAVSHVLLLSSSASLRLLLFCLTSPFGSKLESRRIVFYWCTFTAVLLAVLRDWQPCEVCLVPVWWRHGNDSRLSVVFRCVCWRPRVHCACSSVRRLLVPDRSGAALLMSVLPHSAENLMTRALVKCVSRCSRRAAWPCGIYSARA